MATVTVQPKGDFWYTVISYKDAEGKWKNKMQTTKLPLKGNKKKAEKIAAERLALFEEPTPIDDDDILLEDYLKFHWLPYVKGTVERTTYDGYESAVRAVLVPYFKGKKIKVILKRDRTKNTSSYRTFPMSDEIRALLLYLKDQQAANRELFGRGYNMKDSEYVFVDALGNLIKPDYLTRKYTRLRDQYGLPHVTLHEIRHTVATLLIKHGTQMKYVQEYLGHSNFSTTANIYTHVDVGDAMNQAMTTMTDIIGVSKEGNEKGSTNRQSQNGVEGI